MAETFHGVEIPEEYWTHWNDGFADDVAGFRIGVLAALKIPVDDERNWQETERLEKLADARDEAAEKAWQEKYRRETAAYEEKTDGTS